MVLTMTLPDQYGFVLLCTLVGHFVTSLVLSGKVMAARDAFDVPYPNLYGTPGFHKQADDFNRVQRGHQSMYETSPSVILFCLFGGLQYPIVCSCLAMSFHVGSYLFLLGYADTSLDVKTARYKKGGMLKHVGTIGSMITTVLVAGNMNQWW